LAAPEHIGMNWENDYFRLGRSNDLGKIVHGFRKPLADNAKPLLRGKPISTLE